MLDVTYISKYAKQKIISQNVIDYKALEYTKSLKDILH